MIPPKNDKSAWQSDVPGDRISRKTREFQGGHKPLKEVWVEQQTLSPPQENVVKDDICYPGAMERSPGIFKLRRIVEVIVGKPSSKRRVYLFRNRHPIDPLFRWAASSDPKGWTGRRTTGEVPGYVVGRGSRCRGSNARDVPYYLPWNVLLLSGDVA